MIKQVFDAVFEKGLFRPLAPLDVPLPEGQQVRLIVEAPDSPEEVLKLATVVYEDFSDEQIDAFEQIILNRGDFFGGRTP